MTPSQRSGERVETSSVVELGSAVRRSRPEERGLRTPAPGSARALGRRPAVPSTLPVPLSSLIGRQDDVAAVAEMVRRSRLVTVAGAGGVGKTRLALEVSRGRVDHDPDGAWLVELPHLARLDAIWLVQLASVREPGDVAEAVLAVVADPRVDVDDAVEAVIDCLGRRRALLVLDSCEQVLPGCVDLVGQLLRACPDLRVLTTSRQPLGITGERVWWLQPLPVPPEAHEGSAQASESSSVELFVERALDVDPELALDPDTAPAVDEICRRLDGLPLAIELAAARAAVLAPAEILARLDDPLRLLSGGGAAAEARHRSLLAALDWSHELLAPAEAVLFRRLATFAGSCSLQAAERVCGSDDLTASDVLDLLGALVAKSLVVPERVAGRSRYRMLRTTAAFARTKLDAAAETAALRRRHAEWCVEYAEDVQAETAGRGHKVRVQRLEADHDNFRAALSWARQAGEVGCGLRLANALTWFWQTRGHLREGLDWLQWALATGTGASPARARAMRSAGQMVHSLGDHRSGLAMVDRSVALFNELGDTEEAGGCVCHDLFHMCQNPLHAVSAMERNVARIREMDDPGRLGHALSNLGQARFFRGDAAGAARCFTEVLELEGAGVDDEATDDARFGLARTALLVGDYPAAALALGEVLDRAQRLADPDAQSAALSLLGDLARAQGDTDEARELLVDALRLAHEAGAMLSIARCELFLGAVDYAEGALDAARTRYTQAKGRAEAGATLIYHQVRCTLGLAEVAAATGDVVAATHLYAEAHDAAHANGDEQGVARSYAGRADVAAAVGDVDGAMKLRHQAVELEQRIGDRPAITRSLESLAALATREAQFDRAARLFGAADALRAQHHFARPAPLQAGYSADVDDARQGLGDEAWQEAWDQGARLSLGQAVTYARKSRGRRRRPATGYEALTPAEREVIGLVIEGLTNAEAGERLFISRRTVGHHLAHVYAKLGIHSKRELIRAASTWTEPATR